MQGRVGHLPLHDPRVDARRAARSGPGRASPPRARAATTRAAAPRPPGSRCSGSARDQRGERVVARLPGVAVDVVDAGRAGHERRVGHDQVEPAPGDRGQPRAVEQLDVQPVEREGRPGHRQRAGRDVRGGDGAGVPGGVQRLHPAAGAEVEHGAHGRARRRRRQRERRAADAGDVVALLAAGVEVGEHPPVAAPSRPRCRAVRAQVEGGGPAVARRGAAARPPRRRRGPAGRGPRRRPRPARPPRAAATAPAPRARRRRRWRGTRAPARPGRARRAPRGRAAPARRRCGSRRGRARCAGRRRWRGRSRAARPDPRRRAVPGPPPGAPPRVPVS